MSHRLTLLLASSITCCSTTLWLATSSAVGYWPTQAGQSGFSSTTDHPFHRLSAQTIDRPPLLAQAVATETPDPVLRLGSRGDAVKAIQVLLQGVGYDINVDGVYGDQTKAAVTEFQRQSRLPVDGQVGEQTLQRLQTAYLEANPSSDSEAIARQFDASRIMIATATEPEEVVAGAPEAAPEAAAAGELAEETEEEAAPPKANTWLMGLLGLFSLGSLGALVWYIIQTRRPKSIKRSPSPERWAPPPPRPEKPLKEDNLERSPWDDEDSDDAAPAVQPDRTPAMAEPSVASMQVVQNTREKESSALMPNSMQSEVTRLARVDICDELISDLDHSDPVKRRKAIWELGQQGDSRAVQPLVDLLIDADSHQRSLILAAISEIGIRTLKPINHALMYSLEDENADVRKNAIRDVTRIYDMISQISQVLRHAADDDDAEVRDTARWALSQLNRIRSTPDGEAPTSLPGHNNSVRPDALPDNSAPSSHNGL